MLVSHILREKGREVLAIGPDATLAESARVMNRNRIGALIVRDSDGALSGIISERDIVRALAEEGAAALSGTVETHMTRDVAICQETDTIEEIMDVPKHRFRHMAKEPPSSFPFLFRQIRLLSRKGVEQRRMRLSWRK